VESRSPVNLKKTGAYVYFDHPDTDLWCAAYAFDDEPVQLWTPGEPCPPDLEEHIASGGRLVAHNASFERLAFSKILGPRYGWPVPKLRQWYCTMAMALAQALPAGLEDACAVTQTAVQKDEKGSRVMKQMAKPRRPRKDEPGDKLLWWDDAARLNTLYEYCKTDVEAERLLEKKLRPLSDFEQHIWWLDQEINDRGVAVDVELCNAALKIVDEQRERLDREMRDITNGEIAGTGAVNQIKAYLRDFENLDVGESLAKDTVVELLIRADLSLTARRILELRQEGSKTSVAKIDALLNGTQADGRSRGLLQYHAASTGRWGGRRFQPQNIKRPQIDDVNTAIDIVRTGNLDLVESLYGNALGVVGDCLRGTVIAPEGRKLLAADYSNIEGRVLAWLAGEQWKIDAFSAYDRKEGPDLYKLAYAKAFGMSPDDVDKNQRQVGKVMELSMGYQSGPGAFQVMATGYGVRIGEQWDYLKSSASASVLDRVQQAWENRGKTSGMDGRTWCAAELLKTLWRDAHPATVRFWREMEDAAIATVKTGEEHEVGKIRFYKKGSFLFMELPSGRPLAYAFPKIDKLATPWRNEDDEIVYKDTLYFKGTDSVTRQWTTQTTYGGKLCVSADTEVLTDSGWRKIVDITVDQQVWDGEAWVSHAGVAHQGFKKTISVDGVRMTPDHLVLTEKGWVCASSCEGLHRPDAWLPDGTALRGLGWPAITLDVPVRVRKRSYERRDRYSEARQEGRHAELRLFSSLVCAANHTRHVEASGIRGVALNGGPLHFADAPRLAQLRRAWHHGVCRVAEIISDVLGRHGLGLRAGFVDRKDRRERQLRADELLLDTAIRAGEEPARHAASGPEVAFDGDGDPAQHTAVPMATEAVFDLVNAGPRSRFMVRGAEGFLIVHNCENACQAVARDVMAQALIGLDAWGYETVLTVHDEIVAESTERVGTAEHFSELMTVLPDWADGLPLVAEGFEDRRYRK
jgi:DNA polymerase